MNKLFNQPSDNTTVAQREGMLRAERKVMIIKSAMQARQKAQGNFGLKIKPSSILDKLRIELIKEDKERQLQL